MSEELVKARTQVASPTATATATPSVSSSATAAAGFELRPNGTPSWLPNNEIAIPALVSGPGGADTVVMQATYKTPDGTVLHTIPIAGSSGTEDPSHNLVITGVSNLPLTVTIGQQICCPPGVQAGGYVVYYIASVQPNLPIEYPGNK